MAACPVEEENMFNCMIISRVIIGFEGTSISIYCDENSRFHEKHFPAPTTQEKITCQQNYLETFSIQIKKLSLYVELPGRRLNYGPYGGGFRKPS